MDFSYWAKRCQQSPRDAKARNSWGMALKKCGRYSEAITHFRASVRLDPECTLAYHNLGASLRQTNDLAGAIAAYNTSLKVDPTDALTWYNLGFTLHAAGNLLEAVRAFQKAIGCKEDYVEAHNNLGVVLRKLDDFEGAVKSYQRALELDPNNSSAHRNLAVVLDEQGDYSGAQKALQTAISATPDEPMLYNNLGLVLNAQGDHGGAARALTEALVLNRDNKQTHQTENNMIVHENLRHTFMAQGNLQAEASQLRQLIQIQPKDAAAHNDLGVCFVQQKNYVDAITSFEKAIALQNGQYPEAHNNLGLVLLQCGKHPEALKSLSVAARQSPSKDSLPEKNLNLVVNETEDLLSIAHSAWVYDQRMMQQRDARCAFPRRAVGFGPADRPFGVCQYPGQPQRLPLSRFVNQ